MALGRMASCRAAVPASSPLGEALVKQSLRIRMPKPVAVKHQMMMPGSRACKCWLLNLVQETPRMCLESVQKKSFFAFAFSWVLCLYFTHKGRNHLPKSNCLVQLLFFFPVFCLIEVCGGKDFKTHTYTVQMGQCTGGSWPCGGHNWSAAASAALGARSPVLKQSLSVTKRLLKL